MARRRLIAALGVVLAITVGPAAWAQTTGSIRGRVLDEAGQALPGVTVVVSGETLGAANRTDVTGPSGGFQFASLPIGTYRVTASLAGYQTLAAESVRVSIGAVASVDFDLAMTKAYTQEVTVTAEAPTIDLASPTFNTRFDSDQIINLPTRGHFYDMIAVTPGVVAMDEGSSQIAAFGADIKSSQWNIDGLNRTAPEGGDLSWSMNDELVEEIQVLGTGATAEYGGMLGAAFNVVTKSGTNRFSGSAAFDYWNPDWVGTNARREDAPEGAQTYTLDHHRNLSMTLGGPIKKDRLWFFAGAEFGRFQAFWPFQDSTLPGQKASKWDNYDLKLTSQLAQNHRLDVTTSSHEYLGPEAGSVNVESSGWRETWAHHKMASLDYTGILSSSTVLNVRGGLWRGDNEYRPQYPSDEPTFVDYTVYPEHYYGTSWWNWNWQQRSNAAEAVVSHHADEFLKGSHDFKFGVQYNRGGGTTKTFDADFFYQREYEYYPGYKQVYQYLYTGLPYYYGGNSDSLGVFATDSWKVSNRLTLSLGARYDRHKGWIDDFQRLDKASNPTGEVIPGRDIVDWDSVDPRFGFAWQPTRNGKTVIRGSVGLFHAGMTSGDWYSPPPDVPIWSTSWLNPASNQWELLTEWLPNPAPALVPGTKNGQSWEYTLGIDHQLGATSSITAQAVYKNITNQIGWYIAADGEYEEFPWTDPVTGQAYTLRDYSVDPTRYKGNSTGPGAIGGDRPYEQNYVGAFLTYKKRFANNWDLLASYSYSKSEGLNPRFFTGSWSGQGGVFYSNRDEADPNAFINSDKLLAGDRRHILRLLGNVALPHQFRIHNVVNIQSGRTYDLRQSVRLPNRGFTEIVTQPATDSQRLPTQFLWDLGLGKDFKLGKQMVLSLDLQALNLLNDDAVESWRNLNVPPGEQPLPGEWVLPRRAELRLRFKF